MTGLWRIIVFTAPVMAAVVLIYLLVHQKFEADYAVENVRFEREWRAWEKEFGLELPEDEFLKDQEEEARLLRGKGKISDEEMEELARDLKEVIEEFNGDLDGRDLDEANETERRRE